MRRLINKTAGLSHLWTLVAIIALCSSSCRRSDTLTNVASEQQDEDESQSQDAGRRLQRGEIWNEGRPLDVLAAWYDVPDESLAKRRANNEEFTAAHNRLPIGTLLEVTNLQNGKSVRVRITDRGIRDHRVKLDICKPAAEQLGIVGKGLARVRMQVIVEPTRKTSDASPAAYSP